MTDIPVFVRTCDYLDSHKLETSAIYFGPIHINFFAHTRFNMRGPESVL